MVFDSLQDFFVNMPKDQVVVVYGEPATGKTTLALQAVLGVLRKGGKVFYIDSENSFSLNRLRLMDVGFERYLDNLIVMKPKSMKEQEEMIVNLPVKCGLVVLDSLSKHYRRELKTSYNDANNSVITQLRKLHKYVDVDIPVIITNQVYATMDTGVRAVGGDMLKRWSKIFIKLDKNPRRFVLEKPVEKEFEFKIVDEGLV